MSQKFKKKSCLRKKNHTKKLFFKLAYLNDVNEFTLVPWLISRYQVISLTEDSGRNMLTCNVRVSVCPPVKVDFQNWHSGSHKAVYLLYITYFEFYVIYLFEMEKRKRDMETKWKRESKL